MELNQTSLITSGLQSSHSRRGNEENFVALEKDKFWLGMKDPNSGSWSKRHLQPELQVIRAEMEVRTEDEEVLKVTEL